MTLKAKAKDVTLKAKAKAKDLTLKAKAKAKDLTFKAKAKAKAKDLTSRTTSTGFLHHSLSYAWSPTKMWSPNAKVWNFRLHLCGV